jgi:hypothetical protein
MLTPMLSYKQDGWTGSRIETGLTDVMTTGKFSSYFIENDE